MWKGSPVSSNFSVELCRFIPRSAAQTAVASVAAPHQMRSRSPSECGSRRRRPGGFGNIGRGLGWAKPSPSSRARKSSAWRRAMSASVSPSAGAIAEVAPAVDHLLGRAAADAELQPTAGDEIGGARVLDHVERVLVAHVDDRGADLDAAGAGADGGEQREGRGELPGEVVDPDIGAVGAEFLRRHRELDRLQQRVLGRAGARPAGRRPMAEGQKPDLLHTSPPLAAAAQGRRAEPMSVVDGCKARGQPPATAWLAAGRRRNQGRRRAAFPRPCPRAAEPELRQRRRKPKHSLAQRGRTVAACVAVALGYWVWRVPGDVYYGIPLLNFIGWFVLMLLAPLAWIEVCRHPSRRPAPLLGAAALAVPVACVCLGAAFIGAQQPSGNDRFALRRLPGRNHW